MKACSVIRLPKRTMLQGAGALGQEAARFCTWVGGFLPMPANRERSLSPPSIYRNCTAVQFLDPCSRACSAVP